MESFLFCSITYCVNGSLFCLPLARSFERSNDYYRVVVVDDVIYGCFFFEKFFSLKKYPRAIGGYLPSSLSSLTVFFLHHISSMICLRRRHRRKMMIFSWFNDDDDYDDLNDGNDTRRSIWTLLFYSFCDVFGVWQVVKIDEFCCVFFFFGIGFLFFGIEKKIDSKIENRMNFLRSL